MSEYIEKEEEEYEPYPTNSVENNKESVVRNSGHPLIVLLASLVTLIAAAERCGNNGCSGQGELYAIIGSIVSLVIIVFYMFYEATYDMDSTAEAFLFGFLFVWWGIYAGYTTFEAPFQTTSNGYFGAWLGFFSATALMISKLKSGDTILKERAMELGTKKALILVFSVVVILAGIAECCISALSIVAIVAGGVSAAFIIVLSFQGFNEQYAAYALSLWWLISTVILTFGLFITAGNGYFGCWICLIASVLLIDSEFGRFS